MYPLLCYSATSLHTWQWVTVESPFKHKQTIINAQLLNEYFGFHKQAACIDFPFKAAPKSERLLKEPREGTVTLCINKERAVKARRENSNIVYHQIGRQKMRQTESLDRVMTQCINTEKETESHRERQSWRPVVYIRTALTYNLRYSHSTWFYAATSLHFRSTCCTFSSPGFTRVIPSTSVCFTWGGLDYAAYENKVSRLRDS